MCAPTLRQASATDVDRLEDRLVDKVDKAELQVLVMAELQPLINTLDTLPQRLVRPPRADHRMHSPACIIRAAILNMGFDVLFDYGRPAVAPCPRA